MSWKHRTNVREPSEASPSKRWSTVARSSMEEIASHLKINPPNVGQMQRDLTARKLANTKTSINFGNENINYVSDAMESQQNILLKGMSTEERHANTDRIASMKAALTKTSFSLGDATPIYSSTNREAMAAASTWGEASKHARPPGCEELKAAIKKSSLHFGNEDVVYKSVAHEGMEYKGNQNNFSKLKQEVADMTATLRKHNFSFGEEKLSYVTDNMSLYASVPPDAYRMRHENRDKMKAIILDTRSCHFSLGQDKVHYQTVNREGMETMKGHSPANVMEGIERAKAMKAALQKTSICIGDDSEYM